MTKTNPSIDEYLGKRLMPVEGAIPHIPGINSIYEEQTHLAERELSAFIRVVTELFGPEQARASTEDWLEESELMDSRPQSTIRGWRSVTVAASARLASRIDAAQHRQKSLTVSTDTNVSPIPSSDCFAMTHLV